MLFELGMIALLLVINGLFAGAEIAIVGVDRLRVRQLVEEKHRGARVLDGLRRNPERFLATVQIMITVVSVAAAAFGGARFVAELAPLLRPWLGEYARPGAFAIVVGVVSYLSLVFGELVPKSIALRHSERYALIAAPLLRSLSSAARPLVWLLTKSSNLVLGPAADKTTFTEVRVSPNELRLLVDEAGETGTLDEHVADITSRALGFAALTVGQVMIPRTSIVGLSQRADNEEIRRVVLEHAHSRLPIYAGSLDEITGYVLYKDLLPLAWEGRLIVLHDLIRPPYYVAKSLPAADLLHEMRERRQQLAIVLDEHGGTAGIVTLDDLVDELIGEVLSELSAERPRSVHPQADGSLLVRGDVPIHEINRVLELRLRGGGHTTVAGLCLFLAGGVPRAGTILEAMAGVRLHVERASHRRVELVRVVASEAGSSPAP
jgi:putative hemolysin